MECARQQAPGLVPSGQRPDQLGVRDDSATGRAERIVHQALQHDGHVLLSAESTNDMTKASKPSQLRCGGTGPHRPVRVEQVQRSLQHCLHGLPPAVIVRALAVLLLGRMLLLARLHRRRR